MYGVLYPIFYPYWNNPQKVTFDGVNRLILINQGETEINVKEDIYSDWKEWLQYYDYGKYLEAIRVVGGDPIDETTNLGDTYFLRNGWRIKPYPGEYRLNVVGNVYTDEGSSSIVNADVEGSQQNNVTVLSTVSNLIQTSIIQQDEIEYASFNGGVTIDVINGTAGTEFPVGTSRSPVNNLSDAKSIAVTRGFTRIYIASDFTLGAFDNVDGYILTRAGAEKTLSITSGCSTNGTIIQNLIVQGTPTGYVTYEDCETGTLNNVLGEFKACVIGGDITVTSDTTEQVTLYDCYTGEVSGPPILDMGGDGPKIAIRGYTGDIRFTNKTGSTNPAFIDLNSARVGFDSGITTGAFTVRGVGYIYLNTATGATFDTQGLMSKGTIGDAVWDVNITEHTGSNTSGRATLDQAYDGKVWIDVNNGSSGSSYPYGTFATPVNNWEQAKTIGLLYSIENFNIDGVLTLTSDASSYEFNEAGTGTIDLNGQNVSDSYFNHLTLTGLQSGSIETVGCQITNVQGISGRYINTYFLDTTPMFLKSGSTIVFDNCRSQVAGNQSPVFDAASGSIDLSIRAYSGGIKFLNYNDPTNVSTIEFIAGKLNLDPSDTAGVMSVRGIFALNLNGATHTLDTTGRAADSPSITYVSSSTYEIKTTVDIISGSMEDVTGSFGDINVSGSLTNIENELTLVSSSLSNVGTDVTYVSESMGSTLTQIYDDLTIVASDVTLLQTNMTALSASISSHRTNTETSIKYILGLSQQNFRMTDQIYDVNNNMVTATVRIYNNNSDTLNDTNPLKQYAVSSSYTGELLTSYTMTEI